MNNWDKKNRPLVIAEADDFHDKYDRSGLEMLFYWKSKYPGFKISLFTIPNKTSRQMLDLIKKHNDWIELLVHGWDHDSNFECYSWDYEKTIILMDRIRGLYQPVFKAPGWSITGSYNGYPPSEELPIAKDPQAVYRALKDINFIVFDRHYNKPARPEGLKCVCIDCNDNIIHMHTWDMVTGDLQGKNGFRQIEELHGVPWDQNTSFKFVTEAWKEGLFKPCQT